jgi:hypothetical protein
MKVVFATRLRLVSLDDIRLAAGRIRAIVRRTPLLDVEADPPWPEQGQKQIRLSLKCECFQPGGAFKIRGACNMIAQLPPEARAAGVITYSSGNHGLAVALVAETFHAPAVVVMPERTPRVKVDGVRRHGAEVIFAGTTSTDRKLRAEELANARGLTIIPPFRSPMDHRGAGNNWSGNPRAALAGAIGLRARRRWWTDCRRERRREANAFVGSRRWRRARRRCTNDRVHCSWPSGVARTHGEHR